MLLPGDLNAAFVREEVPEAQEIECQGPDSSWPTPKSPCFVDPEWFAPLITFFEEKDKFRSLGEFNQDLRVVQLFGHLPLPMKVRPDANAELLLQKDEIWRLNDSEWCLDRCFRILQNEGMIKELEESCPQKWQWLAGRDYGIEFTVIATEYGLVETRASLLRNFRKKDGTLFDSKRTQGNPDSAANRKLLTLLEDALEEYKSTTTT